jgi:hypothetical protein
MKSDGSVLISIKRTGLKGFKRNDRMALVRSGFVKMIFIFNLSPATIIAGPERRHHLRPPCRSPKLTN